MHDHLPCIFASSQFRMECNAIPQGWWKYFAASFISSRFYLLLSGKCNGTPSWHLKSEVKGRKRGISECGQWWSNIKTFKSLHFVLELSSFAPCYIRHPMHYPNQIIHSHTHTRLGQIKCAGPARRHFVVAVSDDGSESADMFAPNAGRRHIA